MDSSLKLEHLKNKDESAQSAIASQAVREHLAGFIRSKHLGSSTQINNLGTQPANASGASRHQHQQLHHQQLQDQNSCFNDRSKFNKYYINNSHHLGNSNDDHPLRKTASMPTMHTPYKAQTSSKKRQIARRLTFSPLTKGKTRPKKTILNAQDSNPSDYSSNPCIIQSTLATTSYPRSSSPPLTVTFPHTQSHSMALKDHHSYHPNNQQQPSNSTTDSQPMELLHKYPNRDLEFLQNNLKNSLYFSSTPHSSISNIQQQSQQTNTLSGNSIKGNNEITAMDTQVTCTNSPTKSSPGTTQQISSRQHHLMVNEVVRKTVIQRASSKGRMIGSGSLDMDSSSGSAIATLRKNGNEFGADKSNILSGDSLRNEGCSVFKDELRQLSLDGADMRSATVMNKFSIGGIPISTGSTFHRNLFKLRLATTNDAVTLRRSQSPSSSISMGMSGNQATASMIHLQNSHQQGRMQAVASSGGVTVKHHSSSSSSTSSLLSQQDSLEDSQAIDLSSSSEASRQRQHQPSNSFFVNRSTVPTHSQVISDRVITNQQHSAHHTGLHESFTQMQLCQSQHDGIKQLIASGRATANAAQQQNRHHSSSSQMNQHHQHPPSLLNASKTAISLDAASSNSPNKYMASLTQQYNLSASAQNLICQRQQQEQASNSAQQHDLNQWLLVYNNLIKPTSSDQQQEPNQHLSSQTLLGGVASLAEPYKSNLITQLIEGQQLKESNTFRLECNTGNDKNRSILFDASKIQNNHNVATTSNQRSQISRALSSPLLVSGNKEVGVDCHMEQQQEQGQVFQCSTNFSANQHPHQKFFDKTIKREDLSDSVDDDHNTTGMIIDSVDHTNDIIAEKERDSIGLKSSKKSTSALNSQNSSLDLSISCSSNNNNTLSNGIDNHSRFSEESGQPPSSVFDFKTSNQHTQIKSSSPVIRYEQQYQPDGPINFVHDSMESMNSRWNLVYTPKFKDNASTGLVYELEMCNHKCICGNESSHPENSYRILAIWRRLFDSGLMEKCSKVCGRKATLEELQLCHSETYCCYFGKSPYERIKLNRLDLSKLEIEGLTKLECGGHGADIDTAWNEELTPGVARLAAGCVIEAANSVAKGILMNAFAVVRPPGHHAETAQAMGFCFFNSISIAARVMITKNKLSRVLIVDWDVHHGNGIQKQFYDNKNVMYISLHRHDNGNFFPGTGSIKEIGSGVGLGYNWNIAWSGNSMGDAEYMAAFRCLVMPIARDFNPSIVLVACGFDAAQGHPFNFGGYDLSPACFAYMTRQLMTLANGRLVLCLEGGYQLDSICDCAEACLKALLNESYQNKEAVQLQSSLIDQFRQSELRREPNQSAVEVLYEVSNLAKLYWPCVDRLRNTIELSALEAANIR